MGSGYTIDWWALTIALLRMDTITALVGSVLDPAINKCERFGDLHIIQSNLARILTCDHVRRFPLRPSYVYSLLKLVVARSEATARRIENEGAEEEDTSPVSEDLFELYLDFATAGAKSGGAGDAGICKDENATFYTALLAAPYSTTGTSSSASAEEETAVSHKRGEDVSFLDDESVMGLFVPMRVTSAFVNVGLAVWPAAHITIDLLATLVEGQDRTNSSAEETQTAILRGWFPSAPQSMIDSLVRVTQWVRHSMTSLDSTPKGEEEGYPHDPIRVLELGAGVGLTPAVMHKRYAYASCVGKTTTVAAATSPSVVGPEMTVAVTDYQPNILDNCAYNLTINGCAHLQVSDCKALLSSSHRSRRDLEDSITKAQERITSASNITTETERMRESGIKALAVPLDWNEREQTRAVVKTTRPHLAVAADCIYDRCVLEGLSETLKDAMTVDFGSTQNTDTAGSSSETISNNGCVSIIIQTHRNDATQTELHEKLRSFARVFSFHYDSANHRLVPLLGEAGECGWSAGMAPVTNPRDDQCILLKKCGKWRVEMSDIMFVHFLWMK